MKTTQPTQAPKKKTPTSRQIRWWVCFINSKSKRGTKPVLASAFSHRTVLREIGKDKVTSIIPIPADGALSLQLEGFFSKYLALA